MLISMVANWCQTWCKTRITMQVQHLIIKNAANKEAVQSKKTYANIKTSCKQNCAASNKHAKRN